MSHLAAVSFAINDLTLYLDTHPDCPKGDAITDLFENLAAEQKARTVYENLLRVIDDPDVIAPLKFLRAREIVHFQRFGEALEMTKESLNSKNFYHFNPAFDKTKDLPL